jgi:hypothetical protein
MNTPREHQSTKSNALNLFNGVHWGLLFLICLASTSLAATPKAMDQKLDRIFIFSAVDEEGSSIIVRNQSEKNKPMIFGSTSAEGLEKIREAIQQSTTPELAARLRLTPTSLNYFLKTWEDLRKTEPSLSASIIPDTQEVAAALELLQQQGFSRSEAALELGTDVPVFCPIPAIYAEDKNPTDHHRLTGKRFIPCSLSANALQEIIANHLKRNQTTIIPIPLWKLIAQLSKESDAAVSSTEILAHPSVIQGLETAQREKHVFRHTMANTSTP